MPRVYVGIGSNIDPEPNITRALRMLADATSVTGLSTFYRTPPIGAQGSPDFINGVAEIETKIGAAELKFSVLRGIEEALGRLRGEDKYEPRTIDLDILTYGHLQICRDGLTIPDPDITSRGFLAAALVELDPEMVLPGYDERLADLLRRMHIEGMTALPDFTMRLKQEMRLEP